MKCFKCGSQMKENARFCSQCGAEQGFSEELIEKAKNGDQAALEELYDRTYHSVYLTVKALIKEEDAAEDIVQDSYIKGFRSLEQLKDAEKFGVWIKMIARNRAIDYLRKSKPVIFSQISADLEDVVEFEDDRLENLPEVIVDRKETTRIMKEILDSLSEEQRLAVGMFYYEQMGIREIAETLGISENTVKSRLAYGRKKIEIQVRELENRGTKLYNLAPIPFLMLLFKSMDVQAAEPNAEIRGKVCQVCGKAAQSMSEGTAETMAAAAGKSMTIKVIAGVAAAAVIGVAIGGGFLRKSHGQDETVAKVQQEETQDISVAETETQVMSVTETKEDRAEMETEVVKALEKEEIFASILEEYKAAIRWTAETGELPVYNENFPNVNSSVMRWHYMYASSGSEGVQDTGLYYAYYDIDKNGVEEFLIGRGAIGMAKEVGDVYTVKDGKANKLFNIQDDETFLYVYPDGTMEAMVFNGETLDRYGYEFTGDGTAVEEQLLASDAESKIAVEDIFWELIDPYEQ